MSFKIDKSDWVKVRLGDVAFEYSKRINNPSESEYDRFVGSSNIGQWDFTVKSWESTSSVTSSMKLFEPNDYLLVRRSLYASDFRERAPRAHFHGVCSGDILTIKESPKYIHDGFLIGILNSPDLWKYVVANGSGSITRRIHWKDLANYEFLLPPKDQQEQISELLWAGDEVVEKYEQLIGQSTKLLNSMLTALQLDSYNFDKKGIDTGERKVDRLDSFFVLQRGHDITERGAIDGTIPVVSSSGISYYHNEAKCQPPGVVTGRKGKLGDVFYLEIPYWPHDTTLWVTDFKHNYPKYVYWLLKSLGLQNWNAATAIPTLNRNVIHPIIISVPQYSVQVKISNQLDKVHESMITIENHLASSKFLQKSLINQIF